MPRMTHAVFAVCLCLWLLFQALPSSGKEPVSLGLDQAVHQALFANPDLSALQARAKALADVPDQVKALPDPQLTFRAANLPVDTFSLDQEAMTQMQISLSQALPFPGKLSLRQEIADLESHSADLNVEQQRLMLVRDVKTVWWNIYYLDRALETVDKNLNLFRQLNTIAQTKYQVGKGLQQDVLMAQLELSKLLDNKISLTNLRRNESIRLNTLLAQEADKELVLPQQQPELPSGIPNLAGFLEAAKAGSPVVQDLSTREDAAKRKVHLAELKYYPDFVAGATYGFREGKNPDGSDRADFATVGVTMSIPFFNRTEKERAVSQMQHEVLQQQEKLRSAENTVQKQVAEAYSDYEKDLQEMELLHTGIIPQARQTVASMLAGYQVSKVDFLNLIRAQSSLYDYETRYWKSFSMANQALARLASAIGKENINE